MPRSLVPLDLPPHGAQGRFRNGDLMAEDLDGAVLASASCVSVFAHQFVKILDGAAVKAP